MYLEFPLTHADYPNTDINEVAALVTKTIRRWGKQHNTSYNSKFYKLTYRITFDNDADYTFFMASWDNLGKFYLTPTIKDPMKIDKTRD